MSIIGSGLYSNLNFKLRVIYWLKSKCGATGCKVMMGFWCDLFTVFAVSRS